MCLLFYSTGVLLGFMAGYLIFTPDRSPDINLVPDRK